MNRDAPGAGGMQDAARRKANEDAGYALCEDCDGTGNWLYSMYMACETCGGSGRAPQSLAIPPESV